MTEMTLESRRADRRGAEFVVTTCRLLMLAMWFGAAFYFSATVAPAAFKVLRGADLPNASELAGNIVNRSLGVVNVSGFLVALLLLGSAPLFRSAVTKPWLWLEVALLGIMGTGAAVGNFVWATRIHRLRLQMGAPVDLVAEGSLLRVAFDSLHSYSVITLSIAMLAALAALLVIARRNH